MKNNKHTRDLSARFVAKYKEAKLKTLIFEDRNDPYLIFGDFFSASGIGGHLRVLKKFFKYAVNIRSFKKHPADVVMYYETFCKILNAAWVIDETSVRFADLTSKETYVGIKTGGVLPDGILQKCLVEREISDPYFGIANVFKHAPLEQYHFRLNDWFKLSLCNDESIAEDKKTRQVYKNIVKILICSWLIYEKEVLALINEPSQSETVS